MAPDMKNTKSGSALFIRAKRKDLKWYQKLLNIISGNKEQNWEWILINSTTSLKGE